MILLRLSVNRRQCVATVTKGKLMKSVFDNAIRNISSPPNPRKHSHLYWRRRAVELAEIITKRAGHEKTREWLMLARYARKTCKHMGLI